MRTVGVRHCPLNPQDTQAQPRHGRFRFSLVAGFRRPAPAATRARKPATPQVRVRALQTGPRDSRGTAGATPARARPAGPAAKPARRRQSAHPLPRDPAARSVSRRARRRGAAGGRGLSASPPNSRKDRAGRSTSARSHDRSGRSAGVGENKACGDRLAGAMPVRGRGATRPPTRRTQPGI